MESRQKMNSNVQFRAITKQTSQNKPVNDAYTYSYNIWSSLSSDCHQNLNTSESNSSSSSSSSRSSLSPMSTTNGRQADKSTEVIKQQQQRGGRQLPSTKAANVNLIAKCMEKSANNADYTKQVECSFCKNNGEAELIVRSHALKDAVGRITCPFLKVHTCPICGQTGQNAHTLTYCKKFKTSQRSSILKIPPQLLLLLMHFK